MHLMTLLQRLYPDLIQLPDSLVLLLQEKCCENVDRYIEYDTVLVLLDILLHKSQAYRHVLFNVEIKVTLIAVTFYLYI